MANTKEENYELLIDFIQSLHLGRIVEGLDGEDEIRGITNEDINSFLRNRNGSN